MERNNKNKCPNQWNKDPKKHTKNQWNKKMVLSKNKEHWKPLAHLTKIRKEKTQISKIRNQKEEKTQQKQRNPRNLQRLLQEHIFKWFGKSRRNEQISQYIGPSKTKPRGY
jgi:hypothetical protein